MSKDDIGIKPSNTFSSEMLPNNKIDIDLGLGDNLLRANSLFQSHKDKQNNIEDFDFVAIDEDHVKKPPNRKFDDVCSICSATIFFDKYICCICYNCILCAQCEKEHIHPVIKCKSNKMASLYDIYCYLSKNQMSQEKPKGFFASLFESKIEIKLSSISTKFAMRPNKKIKIPLIVENTSNTMIKSTAGLTLISRNSKDLIIHDTPISSSINKKERHEIDVLVESNVYTKLYSFTIELISLNMKFEVTPIKFQIEVNNDNEDEELNTFFINSPKVFVLTKEQKKKVKYILDQNISHSHPYVIISILSHSNWVLEQTIHELKENNDVSQN